MPALLHLAHLRGQLVVDADAAPGDLPNQLRDGRRESRRCPPEPDARPTSSFGFSTRQLHGVIERRAGCHQRGGGEDAVPMSVNDAFVDVARVAEVVGVRDQVFQCRCFRISPA